MGLIDRLISLILALVLVYAGAVILRSLKLLSSADVSRH
jgi:hypothetical protein